MKHIFRLFIWAILPVFVAGCLSVDSEEVDSPGDTAQDPDDPFASLQIDDQFDFRTEQEVLVYLVAPEVLGNAVFDLYALTHGRDSLYLGKGTFGQDGVFQKKFTMSAATDSLIVRSGYLGLIDRISTPVFNERASYSYVEHYAQMGQTGTAKKPVPASSRKEGVNPVVAAGGSLYNYLDTYDSKGVPDNLAFADVIDQSLLDDVNASLPESKPVPEYNPEYISDNNETRLVLEKEADVWVTYLAEGAGYLNALGYYSYTLGEEPQSIEEIEHMIIFPNVSNTGSGGAMNPGDRVYLGRFPANTVVEWFLVSNGWNGSEVEDKTFANSNFGPKYGNADFNVESTAEKRKHMVALWDEGREINVLGFEDLNRDSGSDDDFNDAIFYARVNPVDAIDTSKYQKTKAAEDSDGDGINDNLDDFPFDPDAAFQNYSPSKNSVGKMVYEDLWPSRGDYDFNDLVMAYSYKLVANSDNLVTRIEGSFTVENIGGFLENGFAIYFPISTDLIESVEGQVITGNYLELNANGTEAGLGSEETVIFVIDNAIDAEGETFDLTITFTEPVEQEDLGSVPFNAFMVIDQDRTMEVHMPDMKPTSKAGHFGERDDFSDPSIGRYYKSDRNLPWAMNVFTDFQAPPERVPIVIQYPRFEIWANSGGTQALDWYSNE